MSYDAPDKSEGFKPSQHPEWVGRTFLIWPTSEETVTFTRDNGESDPTLMVTADVAILDVTDPETGRPVFLENARIGGKGLAPFIRPTKPGREILGKLRTKPAQKGNTYYLDAPEGAEWQAMCQLADQYKAAFPRYVKPKEDAWNASAASTPAQTASSWATPAPAAAAPAATPWNPPAPPPAQQSWGAAPAPAPTGPKTWPPGLADFLVGKGYDVNQIPDEATARQIAATLS